MKKLIFVLSFLISVAYAQNINIAKADIDRIFSYPVNVRLFENSVFSSQDTLKGKTSNSVFSKLSKFQGAILSITSVDGVYVGRIFKTNSVYYELEKLNVTTYTFVKKDATNIESFLENTVNQIAKSKSLQNVFDVQGGPSVVLEEEEAIEENIEDNNMSFSDFQTGAHWNDDIPVDEEPFKSVIYLDMNGQQVNSSMWNYGTPFYCQPVTFANNADSVAYIVNRMKALFYPFAVTVTTDESVYNAAQVDSRIRIIVTPTASWYGSGIAVGYVTSFTWGDDTPCFVFWGAGRASTLSIAAWASQWVVSQTMGLYNQYKYDSVTCVGQGYNTGFGTGETSWAPILGRSVNLKNIWTWNYGPTPNGCRFRQDGMEIIRTSNGFDYRNWQAIPQNIISIDSSRAVGAGELSTMRPNFLPVTNDSAIFKINIVKLGATTITAYPKSFGANNLNAGMKLASRLYNPNWQVVASSTVNDASLNAVISQAIAPGTYYLVVRKDDLPQSSAPAWYLPRGGYGQYGWFYVTMD